MSDDILKTKQQLLQEITDLSDKNEMLMEQNDELADEVDDLKDKLESYEAADDTISQFLSELDRPCGSRKFIIPDNPRVHDAIRAMADAIGRNV